MATSITDDTNDQWNPDYHELSPMLRQFANTIPISSQWPTLEQYNKSLTEIITNYNGQQITFVPQSELRNNYEIMIHETGCVPTREHNWHDYFNAHVWLNFPQTKAMLNTLQYQSITARKHVGARSALENKLTLFDETGVLIFCTDQYLVDLLLNHQWQQLFWVERERVLENMTVVVIGHSLHEKALQPYIGMCAHSMIINQAQSFTMTPHNSMNYQSQLDRLISQTLQHYFKSNQTPIWQPLPILGFPGWHFEKQNELFYLDNSYFRVKRPI